MSQKKLNEQRDDLLKPGFIVKSILCSKDWAKSTKHQFRKDCFFSYQTDAETTSPVFIVIIPSQYGITSGESCKPLYCTCSRIAPV